MTFNHGQGWDGYWYYTIASQFSLHQPIISEAPFIYRVGFTFLAGALFPNNLLQGFFVINLVASIVATFLLMIWLRFYIDNWIVRCILIGMYLAHAMGPLRIAYFYPAENEGLPAVFTLLGLIFIHLWQQRKSMKFFVLLSLVSALGVFFRESLILIPFVNMLATWTNWYRNKDQSKKDLWISPLPFLLSLAIIFLIRNLVTSHNNYSLLGDLVYWLYTKPLPAYFHAYFVAVGPILAILVFEWKAVVDFLKKYTYNFFYLVILCLLSWVIGSDTDRFIFWAVPVWYILIGIALQRLWPLLTRSWLILVLIFVFQGLEENAFRPLPDYAPEKITYRIPLLSVICNEGCLMDFSSYNSLSGSGINTAGCSMVPCTYDGNFFPFRFYLLLENIVAALIIAYSIIRAKRRWRNQPMIVASAWE